MKAAACGHPVDLWCDTTHIVCKTCFGLEYNLNSYSELPRITVEVEKRNQREGKA